MYLSEEFQKQLGYEFYEMDKQTQRPVAFGQEIGRHRDQRYWSKLDDLAWDVKQVLSTINPRTRIASGVSELHRPVSGSDQGKGKTKPKTKKLAISGEEIHRVLLKVPDEYRILFTCVAMTGLRVGELLGLRWFNIDFARSELSITHSLWRRQLVTPKTEASERTLHLPAVLSGLLAEHRQSARFSAPEDFVFARVDGTPQDPDHLRTEVLYKALQSVGIRPGYRSHGFHLFRHSAGSIVHSITRDVKTAQEFLGHSRLSTTADIYTHVDQVVGEEGSEALAKAIAPGPTPDMDAALVSKRVQ